NNQLFAESEVWTAGSDKDTEDDWYWHTDSEKVKIPDDLTDWDTDEPNDAGAGEDCMIMVPPEWKWNDIDCSTLQLSLCEIPRKITLNGQLGLLRPGESKGGEESNGKVPQMLYAKNNQDSTPGSPMLGLSVGPTLLLFFFIPTPGLENPTYQQRPDKNNRYKLLTTLP
ncbi:mannose-binding protein c, partial [Plakobranchus ocellatus]